MKTKAKRLVLCGAFLVLASIRGGYLAHSIKFADAANEAAKGPTACLTCHGGSFDKLASKEPSFKASSGEMINPHRFIPHNEKKVENVPDCTDCHSTHPIPPKGKIDLSKVNVDTCFLACHHQQNFERCNTCHHK